MRIRGVALLATAALVAASCGNAASKSTQNTGAGSTVAPNNVNANLKVHHPITETGVTDTAIGVDVVASINNPLGNNYGALADGMTAYFAMVNAGGGIYGRQLKITKVRDDGLANNATQVQAALSQDNPFAVFIAALLFTGAATLAQANVPTFGWNINAEWTGPTNFFPNEAALCFTCAGPVVPWVAKQLGATKVGVLAYNVPQSADCLKGDQASFAKFSTGKIVYHDASIGFGVTDLSAQVANMKKQGVQLVLTCMDLNGTFTLAKEMAAQGLKAVQVLPNGYDQAFMAANGKYYEGSMVGPQFTAFEHSPQPPEMKSFEKWMNTTHKKVVELSMQGWIAANQFVTGLKLAGPDFNRQKLISAMNTLTDFTAGGLLAPIDWTKGHLDPAKNPEARGALDCGNFVKITSNKFVSAFAQGDKPWVCFKHADLQVTNPNPVPLPTPTNYSFVNVGSTGG
jgi:ABC-type branched-subunit amino acid transport system substrate-binding protein